MIRDTLPALLVLGLAAITTSCSSDGFGKLRNPPRLEVIIADGVNTGSRTAPLALLVNTPSTFKVSVRALATDGSVDTTFNRYVRISAKPGAIAPLNDVDGRNLLVKEGTSVEVDVVLTNAYGTSYIVADDLGYVPADPLRDPPPACANGRDDDGDGTIDFPTDPGCAYANDDSEEGGTYAEGVSQPIFFRLPRIADVRGLQAANGRTPYPREQIFIDTGWSEDNSYAFDTVVTRLSPNGFYVTDLGDTRGGFNSVFAFNFNTPPRMRVCDRMKTYGGTANEFFGFTQISYPTWTLEQWEPGKRLCLVPTPHRLTPDVINTPDKLLPLSANLLRVETHPDGSQRARVTPKFGPDDMPCLAGGVVAVVADKTTCNKNATSGSYQFVPGGAALEGGKACTDNAGCKSGLCAALVCLPAPEFPNGTNCDFDKNGKINSFTAGDPEGDCSKACAADAECTEYSNYLARGTFRITVSDSNERNSAIQADSSASASFDPYASRGQPIRAFTGTMSFFSGGAQYTLEARCQDDIVLDLATGPFFDDKICVTDADCSKTAGYAEGFTCYPLGSVKGCRKVTPSPNPRDPPSVDPPPLACVFPRTILENNPQ